MVNIASRQVLKTLRCTLGQIGGNETIHALKGPQVHVGHLVQQHMLKRLYVLLSLTYSSTRRKGMNTPFSNQDYRPKLDCSGLCDHNLSTIFQNLVGILRWICELGRVDILHETSILSQYLAQPRMGHLTQCLNIFYYLKNHD